MSTNQQEPVFRAGRPRPCVHAGAFAIVLLMSTLGAAVADVDLLVGRARLLRLHEQPEAGAALLEKLARSGDAPATVIDEYILCEGARLLGTEDFAARLADLEKSFGRTAAVVAMRTIELEPDDPDEALQEAEKGLILYPHSATLAARKATLLLQKRDSGSTSAAMAWLTGFDMAHPGSDLIQYWIGEAHLLSAEQSIASVDKALVAFARATALNPEWARPYLSASRALMSRQRAADAFDKAVKAEQLAPRLLGAKEAKYAAALAMAQPPMTWAEIDGEVTAILKERERDRAALEFAARVYDRARDLPQVARLKEEIVARFPSSQTAFRIQMEQIQSRMTAGRAAEAESQAGRLAREARDPRQASAAFGALASIVAGRGDAQSLVAVLDEWGASLETKDVGSAETYTYATIARWYFQAEQYEKTVKWAERARTSPGGAPVGDVASPLASTILELLATSLYNSGRLADAKPHVTALARYSPVNPHWHSMLGRILVQEKSWEPAQRELEEAFSLSFYAKESADDLRLLYRERHGTEEGSDRYIAEVKRASSDPLRKTIIDAYKVPSRSLPAMDLPLFGTQRRVTTKDLAGRVTVLNLWATWCGPCRRELPEFQKFYEKHMTDPALAIYAVNANETAPEVQRFMETNRLAFPILLDSNAWERFGVSSIPHTLIADATGKVRFAINGYNPRADYGMVMGWLVESAGTPVP
ncbi:MAG: redoxin domain-containing protein [Acidobacteria bacterium]|nr:redoxin domain-containing protein [Acidobacteriota bacterium]